MKIWILGSEPVTWKGGLLCPIWKSKGQKQDRAAYRGIVLLPALGKRWHALLRQELLPHVLEAKLDSQFGGLPGQPPGFAASLVRSYSNIAHSHGLHARRLHFLGSTLCLPPSGAAIRFGGSTMVNSPSDFEMLYVRKDWMCQGWLVMKAKLAYCRCQVSSTSC